MGLPPPDRRIGRPRTVHDVVISPASPVTLAVGIEQAIARGESTTAIMGRFSCGYSTVKAVRDAMSMTNAELVNA